MVVGIAMYRVIAKVMHDPAPDTTEKETHV
jgi:hypothetical protein